MGLHLVDVLAVSQDPGHAASHLVLLVLPGRLHRRWPAHFATHAAKQVCVVLVICCVPALKSFTFFQRDGIG